MDESKTTLIERRRAIAQRQVLTDDDLRDLFNLPNIEGPDRPEGSHTTAELAELWGVERSTALRRLKKLIAQGRVEMVPGKIETMTGRLFSTHLYRLLAEPVQISES